MPRFSLFATIPPRNLSFLRSSILFALWTVLSSPALALTATTTTLTVNPVPSVTQGAVLTFQAAVSTTTTSVLRGAVTLYDGAKVLAAVQLVNNGTAYTHGTANYKTILGPGVHALKATYNGTNAYAASTSATATVTVSVAAPGATATSISSTGSAGTYTLTGKVTAASSTPPTGTVSFVDQTNNNFVLGSPALDASTITSGWQDLTMLPAPSPNYGVLIADLNADGIPDLVTSNFGGTTISVYLGNGDGTFQPYVDYTVGTFPLGLTVGDLNGDGIPDLAVANGNAGVVSVLFGNGDGTFQPAQTHATAGIPSYVVMVDVDNDGYLDLVTCSSGNFAVTVLLGNGDGTFASQQSYGASTLTKGLAVGDFNQDGFIDLVVSNSNSNTIGVLLGHGDGTFPTQTNYTVSVSPTNIAVVDLNQDGKQDLVVCNSAGATITVLLGKGDGTFPTQASYPSASGPWGIAAGDFNGDGIPDILITSPSNQVFQVFQGRGDGTLLPAVSTSTGITGYLPALGDLNGDGVTDLVVSNLGSDSSIAVSLGSIWEIATLANITLPGGGQHSIIASYGGDSNFSPSTSSSISLAGTVLSTALAVSIAPPSGTPGQTFSITAAVTPSGADGYSASGTINFSDGGLNIASTVPIVNGAATFNKSDFTIGTHPITAAYSGDINFAASTASAATLTVLQPQTITFPALSAVSYRATPVGLGATASSGLPVVFSIISGSGTLSGNTVTVTGAGNVILQADQAGDSNYAPAPPVQNTLVVKKAMSVLGLTTSAASAAAGDSVTFTAIVAAPPLPVPTGGILFMDGSTQLATVAVDSQGSATYTTSALAAGTHTISASYSGDANFLAAIATPITETVTATGPAPDYSITANPNTLTVPRGSTGNAVLKITPTGGFSGQIAFACAGLPQYTTCIFTPPTVTMTGDNSIQTVQFTLNTSSGSTSVYPSAYSINGNKSGIAPVFALVSPFGLLALIAARRRKRTTSPAVLVALLLATAMLPAALITMTSCGGSGGSAGTGGTIHQPPLGTTNVTMMATAAGGTLHHTATITITITQ